MFWISDWWQQVSGTATQGLQITIVGMSLVFFTLGLIILALILLTRLPGLRANRKEQEQKSELGKQALTFQPTAEHTIARTTATNDAELAQVAAIAVALVRSHRPTTRRSRTQTTTGKWKQYGRAHQLGL